MFGKWFASAYTGSMYGAGAAVFAVWAWVIANAGAKGVLEINPQQLADTIGEPIEKIDNALEYLTAPDPKSRSDAEDGRRLVHEGAFQYRVVNHQTYRELRNEEARREQNREAKRRQRERDRSSPGADNADETQSQPKTEGRLQTTDTEAEGRDAPPRVTTTVPEQPGEVDPKAERIRAVLLDHSRANGLGLSSPSYAAELLGSLGPLALNVTADELETGLREAIADIPRDAPEAFWRKMLRSYVKQIAKKPPGEREHEAIKPKKRRRTEGSEPDKLERLLAPSEIARLAEVAADAVGGES